MVNISQFKDKLKVSYIDEKGNIKLLDIPLPESERYEWNITNEDDKKKDSVKLNWDDRPVKKVKAGKNLSRYRIQEYLLSLPDSVKSKIFSQNTPKMYFCDIETDILEDGFAKPENPVAEVFTIALVSENNKCLVLGTRELSNKEISNIEIKTNEYFSKWYSDIKFSYQYLESEYELLNTFFYVYFPKISLITGWNFTEFDWKYLYNRAKLLGIDVKGLSPTREINDKSLIPKHKLVVDYMDLYKRWDTKVKIKEGAGLDRVADSLLGIKKIKYSGSLKDLYNNDYEHYVYYNIVDAFLVKLIHEKSDTLTPFLFVGNRAKVENLRAYGSVHLIEMIMLEELYNKNRVLFKEKTVEEESSDENDNEGFEGAFVMKPVPDIYEWLATFDFSSLYPTTIRQWNISPDSFIKRTKEKITDSNLIQTCSGSVFKANEDSVLKTILTRMFKERKDAKKTAGIISSEMAYLKSLL